MSSATQRSTRLTGSLFAESSHFTRRHSRRCREFGDGTDTGQVEQRGRVALVSDVAGCAGQIGLKRAAPTSAQTSAGRAGHPLAWARASEPNPHARSLT